MADSEKKKDDPTKDPKFKKVIDHFLTTPPKPHTTKEVRKTPKNRRGRSSAKK